MNHDISPFAGGIPGSAAGTPFRTLTAVLRSIVPELLNYPEVIAQIKAYIGLPTPGVPVIPTDRALLHVLQLSLPDLQKENIHHLMTILQGMKAVQQAYGLDGAQQMDAYMSEHKARFEPVSSNQSNVAVGLPGKTSSLH
jgi:hypothetical protein